MPGAASDNYVRGSETFRSKLANGLQLPIVLAGAHVRVYDDTGTLTLSGSVQTLADIVGGIPAGATHADIYCEAIGGVNDYCRFSHLDNPSTTVGTRLRDHEVIQCAALAAFRAINASGTCKLFVEFYHYE